MLPNPFFYGNPISSEGFIGRRKFLRHVISRLKQGGQSTAIIGDPHIGKSSLLNYLANPEKRRELYGGSADNWYFSSLDVHSILSSQVTPELFWEHALAPLKEHVEQHLFSQTSEPRQIEEQIKRLARKLEDAIPNVSKEQELLKKIKSLQGCSKQLAESQSVDALLAKHYQICVQSNFETSKLERLFAHLKKMDSRFVLLLDEFDALLHHPALNSAEFYGGLRSLASRSGGAFALIIASRTPLSQLNDFTQEFNPTGSPFFNIFSEVTLGPLTEKGVSMLLALAGDRFTVSDKKIIQRLAGKHPFLLQATCAALWECYEEEEIYHTEKLRRYVAKRLYRELDLFFNDTWKVWPPEMCKAFTAVAISHHALLLPKRKLDVTDLVQEFPNWGAELRELEERGLIVADKNFQAGYRVASEIMLTWLADVLVRSVRIKKSFDHWLQEKEIDDAFLSTKEKKVFQNAVKNVANALGQGATTVIEAFSKGLGAGLSKNITGS